MQYLTNNYRCQPKSKIKSLIEAVVFVAVSTAAILLALLIFGWFSASAAEAKLIKSQTIAHELNLPAGRQANQTNQNEF